MNIGVNFCMFLVHHSEMLTLTNLIKFDMESRDIILKRENQKIWQAINSLGSDFN